MFNILCTHQHQRCYKFLSSEHFYRFIHFGFLPATRHKIVEIALVCLIHLDMLRMSAGNNFTMISNELISTALMMGRLREDVYQFIVRPFDHAQPTQVFEKIQ